MSSEIPNSAEPQKPGDKIAAELARHKDFDDSRSILSKAVDFVYDRDAHTLASLKKLQSEVQESRQAPGPEKDSKLDESVTRAIAADKQAMERKSTITNLVTGAAEYAFLSMPAVKKARSAELAVAGWLGTGAVFGLSQTKAHDNSTNQTRDFLLGAAKGLTTKTAMDVIGTHAKSPLLTGALMGSSSRIADNLFDRKTWANGISEGVGTTLNNSFTADAIKSDLALSGAMLATHGALSKLAPELNQTRILSNVVTGTSFGLASGAQTEIHRQDAFHEKRDWSAVFGMSLAQAGLDGLASVPGGAAKFKPAPAFGGADFEPTMNFEKATPEKHESGTPGTPVSALLRSLETVDTGEHNVSDYAKAMTDFKGNALGVRHIGGDSVNLDLADGTILKLTTRDIPERRPFDMPVVESGSRNVDHVKVNYLVQPEGDPNVSKDQYGDFLRGLSKDGYWMSDPGMRNVALHPTENRVVVVDPWSVERMDPQPQRAASGMMSVDNVFEAKPKAPDAKPTDAQPDVVKPTEEVKPFNAFSLSADPAERLVSNFADTPFTFNNRRYKSFESFYQSLKFDDAKVRSEVAKMTGKQAKAAGSKSHATETTFNGQKIEFGSPEHHQILEQALFEKFKQNPEAAKALLESLPRPIIHDTGRPESTTTSFPAEDFTRMLTDIREKLSTMDLDALGKRKK